MNQSGIIGRYFASANSYKGFTSLFEKIFNSSEYEKIYILKGGPGTGKSSFMRGVVKNFEDKECEITELLCSSDPNSLDGVIIAKNDKKIAIIDGTSPHERDTIVPGAIDEIINLGVGWDSVWLKASREKILSLTDEKKKAYTTAYFYLSISGKISDFIYSLYSNRFNIFEAKYKAELIFEGINTAKKGDEKNIFLSSFGKEGDNKSHGKNLLKTRKIGVSGDQFSSGLFLDVCADYIRSKGAEFTRYPIPLDPNHTEGVYINDLNLMLVQDDNGELDSNIFLNDMTYEQAQISCAQTILKESNLEAVRWFKIASDLHARLEEIYSRAMNFEKNKESLLRTNKEISDILDL